MTPSATIPLISAVLPTSSAASRTRIPLGTSGRSRSSTTSLPTILLVPTGLRKPRKSMSLRCEVALESDMSVSGSEDEELKRNLEKVGCRVRLKAPLKVHHVPKVPEVELTPELEGVIKQYVGFWKGNRISANYPFKVQFSIHNLDRGQVKLFVHLREDEFEIID